MAWIKTIPEEQAPARLKEFYEKLKRNPHFRGQVPNVVRAFSLRPEVMEAVSRLSTVATFGGSHLSRVQEELIATVVSSINRCHY